MMRLGKRTKEFIVKTLRWVSFNCLSRWYINIQIKGFSTILRKIWPRWEGLGSFIWTGLLLLVVNYIHTKSKSFNSFPLFIIIWETSPSKNHLFQNRSVKYGFLVRPNVICMSLWHPKSMDFDVLYSSGLTRSNHDKITTFSQSPSMREFDFYLMNTS